jgi:O-antigen ligase
MATITMNKDSLFLRTPTQNATGGAFAAASGPGFMFAWSLALAMLILNFGQVLGLGNINAVEKLFFLVAAICYLHRKSRDPAAAAGLALLCTTVLLAGALTPFSAFSWLRAVFALVALLSLAAFFLATPTAQQRRLMLTSIACTPLVLLAYGLLLTVLFGKPLFMRDHTNALRLGGATVPAFLAAASYAGVVAACFLYAGAGQRRWLALAACTLAICAMSGTRMPSACAAVSAAIILLAAMRDVGARLALIVSGSTLAGAFLLTAGNQILIRILSGSTSGREKIWGALGPWVERYPWTGVGLGHHGLLIPEHISQLTNTTAAHNEYLRLLVELGYPGEVLFLLGLLLLFFGRRHGSPAAFFCTAALLGAFCLYASTDNVFYLSYALFVPLCIVIGMPLLMQARSMR